MPDTIKELIDLRLDVINYKKRYLNTINDFPDANAFQTQIVQGTSQVVSLVLDGVIELIDKRINDIYKTSK